MGCFGNHQIAAVAGCYVAHEIRELHASGIILGEGWHFAACKRLDAPLPLVSPIIIDADDIEMCARTAKFRKEPPAEHVPGLEHQPVLKSCASL